MKDSYSPPPLAASQSVVSILLSDKADASLDAVRQAIERLPAVTTAHFLKPESRNPRLQRMLYAYLAPGIEPAASLDSIRAIPGVASAELPAERHLIYR